MRMICWMRHGNGVHTWPDGKQFEGQFDDGEKIEVGEMTWPNGDRFICYEWEDNIPMGQAEYAWTDGCKLADLNSDWYDNNRLLFSYEISRKLRFSERLASLRLLLKDGGWVEIGVGMER